MSIFQINKVDNHTDNVVLRCIPYIKPQNWGGGSDLKDFPRSAIQPRVCRISYLTQHAVGNVTLLWTINSPPILNLTTNTNTKCSSYDVSKSLVATAYALNMLQEYRPLHTIITQWTKPTGQKCPTNWEMLSIVTLVRKLFYQMFTNF